jgi:DNA-binding NarL/FixJ family response regulator
MLQHPEYVDYFQFFMTQKQSPERILIIDDDPLARSYMELVIEKEFPKADVVACEDIDQALTAIDYYDFDTVICDHNLGAQSTGLDFCMMMLEKKPSAQCILTSGFDENHFHNFVKAHTKERVPIYLEKHKLISGLRRLVRS